MEACYRHRNRETGVACSNCGRPICSDCMTPTPVGMRCPECSRDRTRVTRLRDSATEPTLTYALVAICVLLQLPQSLGGGHSLYDHGALYGPAVANGEVWRIVTGGFLHASLIHVALNMYVLYVLGTLLEPAIGRLRFAIVYLVSLLAGSFGALVVTPNSPTVGASGAIFGLMGAAVIVLRQRGVSPMASGLPLWIGLNLILTIAIPGISIGGHIGGLIGGTLAALVLFELPGRIRMPAIAASVLAAAIGVAAVAGALAAAAGSQQIPLQ